MADTVRRFRVELEASSTSFTKGFKDAASSADSLGKSLEPIGRGMRTFGDAADSTSGRAGKLADAIGRTSTTLARSASAFGLPVGALRALDDVADVAELGLSNLAKSAVGFNAASVGVAGAGFAIGTAIGSWLNTFPAVQKAADSLFHSMFRFVGLAGEIDKGATQGLGDFSKKMAASHAEAQKKQVEQLRAAGAATADIAKIYEGTMTPELQKQLGLTRENVKAEEERKRAAERSAEAFRSLTDELSGRKAQAEADTLLRAFTKEGGAQGIANLEAFRKRLEALQQQGAKITDRGLLAVLTGGKVEIPKFDISGLDLGEDTANALERVSKAGVEAATSWREMAAAGKAAGLSADDIAEAMEAAGASSDDVKRAFDQIARSAGLGESLKSGLKAGLKDLPAVILGAIQGGGDVWRSVGASLGGRLGEAMAEPLTKILSKKLGDTLGGALGSLAGPLGAILGSSLGGLVSKAFGALGSALGIGGDKVIMQVNDLRDAFFEAQGGFVALQQKLVGLTDQDLVRKIFDAKTVEQFNAAVAEVMGLLGAQEEAQQALADATQRYGFTLEELGPAMQRQELDKQAAQLLQDFSLLTASGIDVATVINRMGGNLADFVKQSLKAGQAIPIAMRPMIDQLIASGQLLDENGEAFKSAEEAGITYTETLTEGLSRAVDAINRLVAALTGVPNESATFDVYHTTHYRTDGAPPDGGGGGGGDGGGGGGGGRRDENLPDFQTGTRGFEWFGTGTEVRLHGWEAVVPLGRLGGGTQGDLGGEIRALRDDFADLPRIMARAVASAMSFAS